MTLEPWQVLLAAAIPTLLTGFYGIIRHVASSWRTKAESEKANREKQEAEAKSYNERLATKSEEVIRLDAERQFLKLRLELLEGEIGRLRRALGEKEAGE